MRYLLLAFICGIASVSVIPCTSYANEGNVISAEPEVESRTTNFVTHDLDATIKFYTKHLGMEKAYSAEVKSAKARETYGVKGDAKLTVVGLKPPNLSDEKKDYAGFVFVAIEGENKQHVNRAPDYLLAVGSLVLSHRVQNIDEIERRMKEAGVPIVSALSSSSTGKSRSMTVVDPNGIRIETYQYIANK